MFIVNSKKSVITIILVLVLLAGAVVGIIFLFQSGSVQENSSDSNDQEQTEIDGNDLEDAIDSQSQEIEPPENSIPATPIVPGPNQGNQTIQTVDPGDWELVTPIEDTTGGAVG